MNCRSPYLGDLHCTTWRESIAGGGEAIGERVQEVGKGGTGGGIEGRGG